MKLKRLFITLVLITVTCCTAWAKYVIVDGDHVRLRLGPSTDHPIYTDDKGNAAYPLKGEALPYITTEGDFYKVTYSGGDYYISRDYCHLSDELPQPSKATLKKVERTLLGKHLLSLQWISWDYFGEVKISKLGENQYYCVGEQLSKENPGDYLKLDGYIRVVSPAHLLFTGTIKTKIHHQNDGDEFVRNGTFNFKVTKGRKYWRMMEMANPDGSLDYIDIYMKVIK